MSVVQCMFSTCGCINVPKILFGDLFILKTPI